jgi:hypothetical protein
MADPSERFGPPKRRDLLRALQAAEILLRRLGSDWEELPGHARRPALVLARRLERLLDRTK